MNSFKQNASTPLTIICNMLVYNYLCMSSCFLCYGHRETIGGREQSPYGPPYRWLCLCVQHVWAIKANLSFICCCCCFFLRESNTSFDCFPLFKSVLFTSPGICIQSHLVPEWKTCFSTPSQREKSKCPSHTLQQ